MHRIDAPGHASNLFTEGDPATSVPATVVSDNWLNDVQENIIKVIEAASVPLTKDRKEDLFDALNVLYLGGPATNNFRLVKSGSDLTLERVDGNIINLNGTHFTLTGALPALAPTSLAANTTYYIYAYDNGGTVALEASTTGFTVGTSGRAEKTGDTTRRLVGMARTSAGTLWVSSATQLFVISYHHRRAIHGVNKLSAANNQTASSTPVELHTTEGRVEFLTWANQAVQAVVTGWSHNSTASAQNKTQIGFDSTTAEDPGGMQTGGSTAPDFANVAINGKVLADGYHYATILASVQSGTGTWHGSASGPATGIQIFSHG